MMVDPWYRNFYENMATVQFDHRVIALLLSLLVAAYWWRTRSSPLPIVRKAASLLLAMLVVQVTLGIATLLLVVPLPLAALHQAGAVLLFAAAINAAHAAYHNRTRGPS
jgi:cytochrome c oxidase assembly protein subunit 15